MWGGGWKVECEGCAVVVFGTRVVMYISIGVYGVQC